MNQILQQSKQTIRGFMRSAYSDDKLVELLTHARAGLLTVRSCCCFIGILAADHDLKGELPQEVIYEIQNDTHYAIARDSHAGSLIAEAAFCRLGGIHATIHSFNASLAQKRIIPMVKAEIHRRMRVSASVAPVEVMVSL